MFKTFLRSAVAVTAVLFSVESASAATAKDPLSQWVARVNRQIDAKSQAPVTDASGLATVSFRRGDDGRAHDVAVRSGNAAVAKAAMSTIRRLRNLPPLPARLPADQQIVMNYLVGGPTGRPGYEVTRVSLLASASKNNIELAARVGGTQVASLDH